MRLTSLLRLFGAVAPLALAACGGGGDDGGVASLGGGGGDEAATATTLSEAEAEEALLDWAACMRGHGLDIPDPQVDEDGGVQITVGSGRASADGPDDAGASPVDRDAFDAAREECGDPPRIGGEFTEEDREQMQEDALEFAACMRDEGVEDFPDPDFSREGPGAGPVERRGQAGGDGPVIAGPFGVVDLSDPEVERAFEACQDRLGGRFSAPPIAANRG